VQRLVWALQPRSFPIPKPFWESEILAAKNSPTDAVTTTDVSLTVRAYDHAGLGSPPPEHLGVESGVGMPSPALLLPCNPFPLSERFRAQARLLLGNRTSSTP
jgi:hypothetical protein